MLKTGVERETRDRWKARKKEIRAFPCRACLVLHGYLVLAYAHTSPISFVLASNKEIGDVWAQANLALVFA